MKKYLIDFLICFLIILLLCFISFAVAYGYDEGTMTNELAGKFFTGLYQIVEFPFTYIFTVKYYKLSFVLNSLLYSGIMTILLNKPSRK